MSDDGQLPREKPRDHVPPGQMLCWFLLILAFFVGGFVLLLFSALQGLSGMKPYPN